MGDTVDVDEAVEVALEVVDVEVDEEIEGETLPLGLLEIDWENITLPVTDELLESDGVGMVILVETDVVALTESD